MANVTATLNGPDQWTSPLLVKGFDHKFGVNRYLLVAVRGTFAGTISLQASFDDGVSWFATNDRISAPTVNTGIVATDYLVRAGFAPGDHSSGSAEVLLAQ